MNVWVILADTQYNDKDTEVIGAHFTEEQARLAVSQLVAKETWLRKDRNRIFYRYVETEVSE